MLTLLELALNDHNTGRCLAEELPEEYIPEDLPLGKALNTAINLALNGECDSLESELKNLLIEFPCPEVSKALNQPATFPADSIENPDCSARFYQTFPL